MLILFDRAEEKMLREKKNWNKRDREKKDN